MLQMKFIVLRYISQTETDYEGGNKPIVSIRKVELKNNFFKF